MRRPWPLDFLHGLGRGDVKLLAGGSDPFFPRQFPLRCGRCDWSGPGGCGRRCRWSFDDGRRCRRLLHDGSRGNRGLRGDWRRGFRCGGLAGTRLPFFGKIGLNRQSFLRCRWRGGLGRSGSPRAGRFGFGLAGCGDFGHFGGRFGFRCGRRFGQHNRFSNCNRRWNRDFGRDRWRNFFRFGFFGRFLARGSGHRFGRGLGGARFAGGCGSGFPSGRLLGKFFFRK